MKGYNHMNTNNVFLEIEKAKKKFGGLTAVSNFSLHLKKGELKGLIGPNGAGKTTVFNLITGFYKPDDGKILFKGVNITNESPDMRVNRGIGRTFQEIRMQKYTTVIDEIKVGFFRHIKCKYNFFNVIFQTSNYISEEKKIIEKSIEIMDLLDISNLANQISEDLPFGLQRKVSIARALALKPELLLLDEPASGLNPNETRELIELIYKIKEKFNLTIIIIEHDMSVIMTACNDITAMNEGNIIGRGTPKEIQNNKRVIESYLGGIS
jgi:branched-chain amino acid transport system ATP-binding protein